MNFGGSRVTGLVLALTLGVAACGGGAEDAGEPSEQADATATTDESETSTEPTEEADEGDTDGGDADEGDQDASASGGNGVILADLCAGGQPLNGAVSLDDLVSYGILSSTDATIESNSAYGGSAYDTFGFICNITEDVGDGENTLTIGVNSGPETFQLAIDQGDAAIETIGEWEVIVGSNWLSPLAMRGTDAAGGQHSVYALWTPADGSIPDAATLERVIRPLAEALAGRSTLEIPQG